MILLALGLKGIGLMVGQLLLSLSILVILHEFGHYITARWFKCRVEKFFLFFDPWFALVKKKVGDTVYGIGWLPLGGYVKISGMIDESMDKEQMKQPAQPWEFRSKPAWQRLIVMMGGVIMNIIVAFLIYAMILAIWGDKKIYTSSFKYGVHVGDTTLMEVGFKDGDKILSLDGKPAVFEQKRFLRKLFRADTVAVDRNGSIVKIAIPVNIYGKLIENKNRERTGFLTPRIPAAVYNVDDTSKAYKFGLRNNDYIVGVDSIRIEFMHELSAALDKIKNKEVLLSVKRDTGIVSFKAFINEESQIGFTPYSFSNKLMDSIGWLKYDHTKFSGLSAIPAGVKKTFTELNDYIGDFKAILNPKTEAYKGVGGFRGMSRLFSSKQWDWEGFWTMTALLSVILAFMNMLPIPGLDGGHVMFTLWEMITGRKPNEKFMEYAQIAGMIILLALMLYANGNDWFGWGK
jgi:regulator of sigma E protease